MSRNSPVLVYSGILKRIRIAYQRLQLSKLIALNAWRIEFPLECIR